MPAGKTLKTLVAATALIAVLGAGTYGLQPQLFGGLSPVQAAPAPAPQAVPVNFVTVSATPVRLWTEFSGRLSAVDSVELRPQVSGTITEIRFADGQSVEAGEVLVVIDPKPHEATVAEAKAELGIARHTLDLAKKQRARAESLVAKGHVSQSVLDERISDHTVALSQVARAKAQLEQAEIDLDHAYVKAPIDGRLSRAEITLGNLVEAGPNAPVLTSIVSTGAIYADFDVDERTYLTHMQSIARAGGDLTALPVELTIDAGQPQVYQGRIHSFDNRVDPATGTIRARAIFDNADGSLLPGLFAELRLGGPSSESVILVDAKSIGTDQDRKFVYLLDEADRVTYREITLGATVEGARVVTSGLAAGERLVVEGLLRVRPGMTVAPQPIDEAPALAAK